MKPHSLTIALLTAILFAPSGLYGQALDYSQLVSLWRLNGNAADTVGPNNGSWAGNAAYDAGPQPGTTAAVFEGSNFINAGKGIAFDRTDAFTATAWFKGPAQNSAIIGRMIQGGTYTGWEFHMGDRPDILNVWIISEYGPDYIAVYGMTPVMDEAWHHLAMTYDGSGTAAGVRIYVDGQDDTAELAADSLTGTTVPEEAEVGLGTRQSGANHTLRGSLYEVSLWKAALDPAQIQSIFENGVQPPLVFAAGADAVFAGMPVTLSWEAEAGTTLSIDQGIGDVTAQTVNGRGSKEVSPEATATYTLTAVRGGSTQTKSVTVGIKPLIVAFDSSVAQVPQGAPVTLSWTAHPQAELTLTPGVGDLTPHTTNGVGQLELTPSQTTTFLLRAQRGQSVADASVTVSVSQTGAPDFSKLVSLWRFNEDLTDSFGQSPGLYYGFAEEYTDGPRPGSRALVFDGTGYVAAGQGITFDTTTPFSAVAWVNGPFDQDSTIVGRMRQGGTYTGWELHVGSDAGGSGRGRLNVWLINAYGSNFIQVNSPAIVMDDTWHHVAFTYDGSGKAAGVRIYVDGKDVTGAATGDDLSDTIVPDDAEVNLGTRQNGAFHTFRGSLSEVSVWSSELTLGNIAYLQEQGIPGTLPPPDIRLSDAKLTAPGTFSFAWNSEPGKSYRVETSTNLKNWSVAAENHPSGGATTLFTESPASKPASFYRASPK